MSGPTFVAYIDESGDEGFKFGAGSSEWFVISAAVFRHTPKPGPVELMDKVRATLQKQPRCKLHFRDLKHEQRLAYVGVLAAADFRAITIFAHKPTLAEPETFRARYRLYFYATRYLLERVSWYCRDHKTAHDTGDGSAELVFSNRAGMSYGELKEYLALLRQDTSRLGVQIDWNVIRPEQVQAQSPMVCAGLLVADAVASGFAYAAVEPSRYGFTEDRYARIMKPVVYRYGRYRGYGLKFWPREFEPKLESEGRFAWMREGYK
ncbi:MAG: DUF3800 domain-containing protein [candidate division WOR-3 bacterium]|nr:DUF3800 domain-containing protein [candidate division WOR-3 bacterium]